MVFQLFPSTSRLQLSLSSGFTALSSVPTAGCISSPTGCWTDTVSLLSPFSLTPLLFPTLRSLLFTPIFFRPAMLSRVEPLLRASPLALWAAMPARSIPSPGSQLTPSSLALTRLPPTASPSFSHLLAAWNGLLLDKPSSCSLWTGVCRTSVG